MERYAVEKENDQSFLKRDMKKDVAGTEMGTGVETEKSIDGAEMGTDVPEKEMGTAVCAGKID